MLNQKNTKTFFFNDLLEIVCSAEIDHDQIERIEINNLRQIWIAFINHVNDEIKLNRRIKVFDFFIIGLAVNKKNIQIEFTKKWLKQHDMNQVMLEQPPIIPIRRLFIENVQKFTDLRFEEVKIAVNNLFSLIEDIILNHSDNMEIELQYLGRIIKINNVVNFVEIPQLDEKDEKNSFLKNFIQKQHLIKKISKIEKNHELQKIKKLPQRKLIPLKSLLCKQQNENSESSKKQFLKPKKGKLRIQNIIKQLRPSEKTELATHPLSLNQQFSELVNNPNKIFSQILQKPSKIKQPAPLIFDAYSHTKACPLNLQYNSFSISSRIAINYTPLSKYIYLNFDTQKIMILKNNENKALFLRQEPEFLGNNSKTPQELSKERYQQYITEFITDDSIIEFPLKSFQKIMSQDYGKYKHLMPQDISDKKLQLENEIKQDFKIAAKKILLDYVLKEDEEKTRLGINQVLDPCVEYGEGKYNFQLKNFGESFAKRKLALEKNMILYSETTHKVVDCWKLIQEKNGFNLEELKDKAVTLEDFLNIQREQLSNLRNSLCSTWVKEISQIYKKNMLTQSKREMRKYFDCVSVVISQQVRQLIVNSINSYLNFMRQFKKNEYLTVEECLLENQNLLDPLQKSFLILRLKEEEGKIVFENKLESVKEQLVELLKDGVKNSDNIPRPENFFYRSEKNILQIISLEEEIVQKAIEEIQEILDLNFVQLQRVEVVFAEFVHLFTEHIRLDKILSEEVADIEKYLLLHQKYKAVKDQVVEKVPQMIYMNLARVDCSSLKKRFIDIINELGQRIIDRVLLEISTLTQQIEQIRKKSLNQVSVQVDTVEKLIGAEKNLEEYQKVSYVKIQNNFKSILEWYSEFYLSTCELNKDVFADIQGTISKISSMDQEIEKERK